MDFPLTDTAKCLDADVHVSKAISYAKYRKALSLWMAPYVGSLNAQAFLSIFGTKSGRAGGASAACNAGRGGAYSNVAGARRMEDRRQFPVHSTFESNQASSRQSHHDCSTLAGSSTNRTDLAFGWSKLRPQPI